MIFALHVCSPCLISLGAGIDLDEARRKREDNIVQMRKDKRDENLQKKRMVTSGIAPTTDLDLARSPGGVQQKVRHRLGRSPQPALLLFTFACPSSMLPSLGYNLLW